MALVIERLMVAKECDEHVTRKSCLYVQYFGSRDRAFRILTELLAPSGMLVVTLRHGPSDGERKFYEVSRAEIDGFARQRAVMPVPLPQTPRADELKRDDVWWEAAAYRLPVEGILQQRLRLNVNL